MSETFEFTGKEVPFAQGRYLLSNRLGNGSFGDIFEGWDTVSKMRVAVKLEKKKIRFPQLEYESKVYRTLLQLSNSSNCSPDNGGTVPDVAKRAPEKRYVIGIPQLYYYQSEGDYNIMVMELCGPSLEDVFNYCHRRFSLKTVLMIADQLIRRLEYIHDRGFLHRDIKPENFVFGVGLKSHVLHAIDFGLSKQFYDINKNVHVPFTEGKPLTGTARYCSANTHRGYEQSRRDDLESVGFLLVYFLKGSLPWQGLIAKDTQQKTIKIGEKKIAIPLKVVCDGVPHEFLQFSEYCRSLSFQMRPNYGYLCSMFRSLGKRMGYCTYSAPPSTIEASGFVNPLLANSGGGGVPTALGGSLAEGNMINMNQSHSHVDSGARSATATTAAILDQSITESMRYYVYDWEFDWIRKRALEVRRATVERPTAAAKTASTSAQRGNLVV